MKLNFDGSFVGNIGLVGYGCVAPDSKGHVVFAMSGPLGIYCSMKTEVYAKKEKCVFECMIESDWNTLIKWAEGS